MEKRIRQWEFLKIRVFDDYDAQETARIMKEDGWKVVTLNLNPIVLKRKDGKNIIKQPDKKNEPDPSGRLGDQLYV